MGIETWWEGNNGSGLDKDYECGYNNGYKLGKRHGREELADELNNYLSELKKNHTMIDIITIIKAIEARKQEQ